MILKLRKGGGSVSTLAGGSNSPAGIAVDSSSVYWTEFVNPGTIKKVPLSGGSATVLANNSNTPGIAVDGVNVYWTESVWLSNGKVNKVPVSGGVVTTLARGLDKPWDVAVDSSNAYWVEYNSNGAVKQVAIGGCSILTLAGGLAEPVAIAIDDISVYWIERNGGGPGAGMLKKVAKGISPPSVCTTIDTSPSGLQITVDDLTYIAPQTFNWEVDSTHIIGAPSPQSGGAGTRYIFIGWSDDYIVNPRTIWVPSSSTTYTAIFKTQYQLTTAVYPSEGGSISPDCSVGCYYDSGTPVQITATPNPGYTFASWGGACAGQGNPCSVTMDTDKSVTATFQGLPDIDVQPPSWDYGNVTVGSTSDKGFTVQNTGTAPLNVLGTSLVEPDAGQFAIISGGGAFSLAPGGTRIVTVRFAPTSKGTKSATLRFTSDDPDENPKDVPLNGTGSGKTGGSQSSHRVDEATREVFRQIKQLAGQGQPFNKIVQAQFVLQTFERLPIGTGLLEPTALTGGRATIQLTSTKDPNLVSVRILSLVLEGKNFSFKPDIKAIAGTLDVRTGAFHLTLSFRRLKTPETPQPFTWEGTADGVYDFESGVVSLTEIGQGAFLPK